MQHPFLILVQIQLVLVAAINGSALRYVDNESSGTVWPGNTLNSLPTINMFPYAIGFIPGDGNPIVIVLPVKLPLVIVYYVLAAVGVLLALICAAFNFTFRNRKYVSNFEVLGQSFAIRI